MLDQRRDVLGALPQRRHREREDDDAVVEILAERALAHQCVEVAVGGRDDAHVDGDRAIAADPLDLALLEHAQQLGLHGGRHVADLVEEERAALGLLELAEVPGARAGEGALLVPEQLRLDQLGRHRGAVERHEGRERARALAVDRTRNQLLAGAGLADDADARLTRPRRSTCAITRRMAWLRQTISWRPTRWRS